MKSGDRGVRLSVAITGASIRAARGDVARSLKDLEEIVREAHNAKLIQFELEARLALAEIEMQSGQTVIGRAHLRALERDAKAKGFLLIARKAAAARKG